KRLMLTLRFVCRELAAARWWITRIISRRRRSCGHAFERRAATHIALTERPGLSSWWSGRWLAPAAACAAVALVIWRVAPSPLPPISREIARSGGWARAVALGESSRRRGIERPPHGEAVVRGPVGFCTRGART